MSIKVSIKGVLFENVSYRIDKHSYAFSELIESEYIGNLILQLSRLMGADFYKYEFILYVQSNHSKGAPIIKPTFPKQAGRKQVIIYMGDESSFIPAEMAAQVYAVFKHRLETDRIGRNIFCLPTGYNRTTKHLEVTPIHNRKYNVFFFGQLSAQRIDLYKTLAGINWFPSMLLNRSKILLKKLKTRLDSAFPSSFLRFTSSFQQGFGPDHYATTLYNSKIALCPYGNCDKETMRHFEAMRAGCIVICLQMPDVFYFRNSPIIQLEDWSQLKHTVHNLLANPALMESMQLKTLEWWEKYCSEEAVAAYMLRHLRELEENGVALEDAAHVAIAKS